MRNQSNALWPSTVNIRCAYGTRISTDVHPSEESASSVALRLRNFGLGGEGKVFPIVTWVSAPTRGKRPPTPPGYQSTSDVSSSESTSPIGWPAKETLLKQFVDRASKPISLASFDDKSYPIELPTQFQSNVTYPFVKTQHVLRMKVQEPGSNLMVPQELLWLRPSVVALKYFQASRGLPIDCYIYVTVRSGTVKTTTDDLWHTDGFSMRTVHNPEQNYVWSSNNPTEFMIKSWNLPTTFDPLRHNLHRYLQQNADGELFKAKANTIYLIDPYCAHRRPTDMDGTMRSFVRVSFVPIEIEDDTCAQNPLLPSRVFGRTDVRKSLVDWTP